VALLVEKKEGSPKRKLGDVVRGGGREGNPPASPGEGEEGAAGAGSELKMGEVRDYTAFTYHCLSTGFPIFIKI